MPSPSLREICVAMGFRSTNAASDLVQKLEDSGAIVRDPRRARSIRLVRKPAKGIPLLGNIPAGHPDPVTTAADETVAIDPLDFGIRGFGNAFALRVRGDSMIGRNLVDGDLVLCDRSASPRDRDIVAALIDRETTLKTLVLSNGKAWLKAENPAYPDLGRNEVPSRLLTTLWKRPRICWRKMAKPR
jgi:repressor LexA